MNINPCSKCNYECLKKQDCPKSDDMVKIYESLKVADGIIIFSPVYDGRPPSLYYAMNERFPAFWMRQEEGFNFFKRLKVAIVVLGQHGGNETMKIIEKEFKS